jgi:FAD/FMN-containing dehydrogenase
MTDDALDLGPLRSAFRGELISPSDGERYARARATFNAMYDERRPALIARVTGVADIKAVLAFAREQRLPIAVRSGGHSVAGYSTVEGGVVIDLGALKGIRVDPLNRRARAQAGVTWGELDRETQVFGLATTGGRVSSTGLPGFTLGSGSGWLERLCGLSCDNLISADLITADGQLVTASAEHNPDLLWGLRGGGGNFGIVTELEYRLHPIGPTVLGGLLVYPRAQAGAVLRNYRDFIADAPRELGGGAALMTAPPAPFVPAQLQGKPAVAVIVAWFGDLQRGERFLAPLRAFGEPAADIVQPMPYVALQSMLDAGMPHGRRNYWRSDNFARLPDEAIDVLIAQAGRATSPLSQIILGALGGAVADVAEDATALGGRASQWLYHCYGVWLEREDDRHIAWVRETEQRLRPYATGKISINFVSDAGDQRIRRAFGASTYERLAALKRKYDPDNVFRLNQNVQPAAD